jgi:hypothetical protein
MLLTFIYSPLIQKIYELLKVYHNTGNFTEREPWFSSLDVKGFIG